MRVNFLFLFYFFSVGNNGSVEVQVVLQTARASSTMPEVREEVLYILRVDGTAEGWKRGTRQMPELQ